MGNCCYLTVKEAVVLEDLGVSSHLWEIWVVVVVWLLVWEVEAALQAVVGEEVEVLWIVGRAMAVDQRNGALPVRKRVVGWGRASEGARWAAAGRQSWSAPMSAAPTIPVVLDSDPPHC